MGCKKGDVRDQLRQLSWREDLKVRNEAVNNQGISEKAQPISGFSIEGEGVASDEHSAYG
jgi:hypothetical protein